MAAGSGDGRNVKEPAISGGALDDLEYSLARHGVAGLNPAKTSEIVARRIADEIVRKQMVPGDRLPAETEMMGSFDVGRSTIREALRLLETRGVLVIKRGPGGGPVVRRPRPEDLSEALTLLLQLEGASLRDVIDARQALEPTLARLAAERISDGELDALEGTVLRMREAAGDHEVFLEQNWVFHKLISRAARSVPLQAFVDSLKSIWDGAIGGVTYSASQHERVANAHDAIIAALRARDADGATSAMNAHLAEAAEYWAKEYAAIMEQPLRWLR